MGIRASVITGLVVSVTVVLGAYVASAAGAHDQSTITTPDSAGRRNAMDVLALQSTIEPGADEQVVPLFTGPRRALVQITLRNGATLEAHKAAVPITIHCVAGSGTLTVSGPAAAVPLKPGVLVTLEPDVVHEVVAAPSVSILLTRFTDR
jgi:quercetin dioxygenase-like cupin family protein